jgi:dimethylhistidine N-methyltransferase
MRNAMSLHPPIADHRALARDRFRADVLHGLGVRPKQLPCKYFYDVAGSHLYEQICELDEYYLNRAGQAIMRRHALEMAGLLGPGCLLIEYGPGSGVLTSLLLDGLTEPVAYVPIDISPAALQESAAALSKRHPEIDIVPLCADFTAPVQLPALRKQAQCRAVYFAGSTIGNFPPAEAIALLRRTAHLVGPGGGLLLGADLKKDPAILHAAYNDSKSVTAAFNLNLLVRINRELGADFQVDQFWHHAAYNPREGRIEMYLVSKRDQRVHLAGKEIAMAEGEAICTEYSHKYSLDDIRQLAEQSGFALKQVWTDAEQRFSVTYLVSEASRAA